MEGSVTTPPDSVVKALSKPSGRSVAKAVGSLIKWANAGRDHALEQKSQNLLTAIMRAMKTGLPSTDPELIGGFCADLLDLWETGQKLDKELQKLKKLRLPKDREALRDTLHWINAIQLDMASYWIEEVRKDLPKLLKALDGLERKEAKAKRARRPGIVSTGSGNRRD